MAITAVTLRDPVSGYSVALMPADGITCSSLDVQPSARAVSEERVGGWGQVDNTQALSVAAATLSLMLYETATSPTMEAMLDSIGPLLVPGLRPALIVSSDGWAEDRQLTVRFDSKTGPFETPAYISVAIGWKVPSGLWEAAVATQLIATAVLNQSGGLVVASTGVGVPSTGVAMTGGDPGGTPVVTSVGDMPVPWTANLYGPCTAPQLTNDTTGKTINFTSALTLGVGEYVALDSQARTALKNSDPTQSVLGDIDFSVSDWWTMAAGNNLIRYHPASAAGGSEAIVTFRPAWIP